MVERNIRKMREKIELKRNKVEVLQNKLNKDKNELIEGEIGNKNKEIEILKEKQEKIEQNEDAELQ